MVAQYGEDVTFAGDPALQLSQNENQHGGLQAGDLRQDRAGGIRRNCRSGGRARLRTLLIRTIRSSCRSRRVSRVAAKNPHFSPAFPAATNPVLRRPPRPEGRVWLENPEAIAVVDLANAHTD